MAFMESDSFTYPFQPIGRTGNNAISVQKVRRTDDE